LLDEPVLGLDANNRDLFYRLLLEKYSSNPCTLVISTHLIEEAANVIENVVIIKKGKILRSESCESLLAGGYTVSGTLVSVDAFTKGKNIIGSDSLGGLKTAYILGKPEAVRPDGLEISGLNLQKLFIQLTNI
jgi:ABC-2 type transport system ATP-binding protein